MFKKLLLLLCLATPLFAQDITGVGTVGDPFILYNWADFDSLHQLDDSTYVELANDIDAEGATWTQMPYFGWYFDGKGYTISNMIVSGTGITKSTNHWIGMFSEVAFRSSEPGFYLKNVVFETCSLSVTTLVASKINWIHFFVGKSAVYTNIDNVTFDRCYLSVVEPTVKAYANPNRVSYFPSYNTGFDTLQRCAIIESKLIVSIPSAAGNYVALLVASDVAGATIRYNYTYRNYLSYTNPTSDLYNYVGTLAGYMTHANVNYSFAFQDTIQTAIKNNYGRVGGIAGYVSTAYFQQLYGQTIFLTTNNTYQSSDYNTLSPDYDNTYTDTTTGIATHLDNGLASADFTDSTKFTNFNWTYWTMDQTGAFLFYPTLKTSYINDFIIPPAGTITLTEPALNDYYFPGDSVTIAGSKTDVDTIAIYYSTNSGGSWIEIETDIPIDTLLYKWLPPTSLNGSIIIKVEKESVPSVFDLSDPFYVLGAITITILSPIDSTTTDTLGNSIDIIVEVQGIDSLSLFYGINDSNWIPIILNIPVVESFIDTITYAWTLPNIRGTIYLKASNVADTATYTFEKIPYYIGPDRTTTPLLCWYESIYFGHDLEWPSSASTPFNRVRLLDNSCGWGSYVRRITAQLRDDGTGIDYWYGPNESWSAAVNNPLVHDPVYLTTALDTTAYALGTYYTYGDSVTYKSRQYFFNYSDSTLRCKDLRNDIDSIYIADLKATVLAHWNVDLTLYPIDIQIYNVQYSKISGEYFATTDTLENLNDALFKPLLLLRNYVGVSGIKAIVVVEALDTPSGEYVEDIVTMFTSLTIRRDYFRGIDPKARKKNR